MPLDDPDPQLRENLRLALRGLASVSLREGATRLLNVLGYYSERTRDRIPPELKELQDAGGWPDVQIIFQITEEEIEKAPGRKSSRGRVGYEQRIRQDKNYQSLLFLAIDLPRVKYGIGAFTEMTKAVNSIFQMPVVVLFRCASLQLALAVVHRRARKRSRKGSRTVLQDVKLTRNIPLKHPNEEQLNVLLEMQASKGSCNFLELHKRLENILSAQALNKKFNSNYWMSWAGKTCKFPGDDAENKGNIGQVARLFVRLITVQSLREEGTIPSELFDEEVVRAWLKNHTRKSTDYYRAILQNLFLATLNVPIERRGFGERSDYTHEDSNKWKYSDLFTETGRDAFVSTLQSVPFINDAQFDRQEEDGRCIEGFTGNERHREELDVPASLFFDPDKGLFAVLKRQQLG